MERAVRTVSSPVPTHLPRYSGASGCQLQLTRTLLSRYPPALDAVLAKAKSFQQLEDFNRNRNS